MPAPTLVILSRDKDFAQPLAEQVRRELPIACLVAENSKDIAKAALIITTEAQEQEFPCPVLAVTRDKGPLRMRDVLDSIAGMLPKDAVEEKLDLGRGYVLHVRQKQLAHTGSAKEVSLTDKEVQLLQCLADANGQEVTKERLLKEVWGFDSPLNTHTLETHIYRLRGKLRELAEDDMIIAAEGGYKWK